MITFAARSPRNQVFVAQPFKIEGFFWESFDYPALIEDFAKGLADVVRKGINRAADLAVRALNGSRARWRDSKAQAIRPTTPSSESRIMPPNWSPALPTPVVKIAPWK